MIHFIKMITFLILAGFSLIAQANCTISNAMAVNPVGPLTYKGQADGAVIGSQIGSGWGGSVTQPTVFGNCGGATKQNAYVKPRDIPTGVIYSNAGINYPIYPTGVNGIGYVIGIKDPYASAYISISPPQVQTFPTAGVSNDPRSSIGYTAQVLYVITGTLKTGTYVVPSKIIADLTITNAITGAMFASPTTLTLGGVTINVTAYACSLNSSNITVPLGDTKVSQFKTIGSTSVQNDFNVSMNCDASARVNVSMSAIANTDVSSNDVIALTGAGATDVASGLGVQILYNGDALKLNNNIVLKTSAGGQETFSFIARYYQTKATVTPGKANAVATLNLTYQ